MFKISSLSYLEFNTTKVDVTVIPKCIVEVDGEEYLSLKLQKQPLQNSVTVFHKAQELNGKPDDYHIMLYMYDKKTSKMLATKIIFKQDIQKIKWFYDFCEKNIYSKYPEWYL